MKNRFAQAPRASMISIVGRLLCCGLMLGGLSMPVHSQAPAFPSRMIKIVAPFPAGGSADIFARIVAQKLNSLTGQPVIIDLMPGASGMIGTRAVIGSPPDGYTLVSTSAASALVPPSLVEPRPFDAFKDLAPITPMANVPAVLVVNPQLGIRTLSDLVKYAKANPGKLNIGSSGTGTIAHLAAELLKRQTMIDIVHVPYQGAPRAITDLIGGQVQLMFSDASFFLELIKAGKLIPLAVGSAKRIPSLPDVPTTAELGYPSLVADNYYCLFAPGNTPADVVEKLNSLVLTVLNDEEVKAAYAKRGAIAAGMTTTEFKALMKAQGDIWVPLAKETAKKAN